MKFTDPPKKLTKQQIRSLVDERKEIVNPICSTVIAECRKIPLEKAKFKHNLRPKEYLIVFERLGAVFVLDDIRKFLK